MLPCRVNIVCPSGPRGLLNQDFILSPSRPNNVSSLAGFVRFMPSSVVGSTLLHHRVVRLDCSVAACRPLAVAPITSSPVGDKRTAPGRRTAHLFARADKQSMDSSALIAPPKQDKQVTGKGPFAKDRFCETCRGSSAFAHNVSLQIMTLPTVLTLLRVASIPMLIGGEQYAAKGSALYMLPFAVKFDWSFGFAVWFSNLSSASMICSGVFIIACLTDYLDGYLARKMVIIASMAF